jgi:hypothetical protein
MEINNGIAGDFLKTGFWSCGAAQGLTQVAIKARAKNKDLFQAVSTVRICEAKSMSCHRNVCF